MLVDTNNFRRILRLKVNKASKTSAIECDDDALESRRNKENILDAIKRFKNNNRTDILYVGPNYFGSDDATNPNDPEYTGGNQWAINHLGLSNAWDITTGSTDILVGVMDTGVHGAHLDLMNNLDNTLHMDFTTTTPTQLNMPVDSGVHGTHVAGIIGAEGDNSRGIVGSCWNVNLVSLRISNGYRFTDWAILGVDYAVGDPATGRPPIPILNFSGRVRDRDGVINANDPALEQSLREYPGLFVVSSGNDGTNNDINNAFPTNYSMTLDNVISVGSIDVNSARATSSNYGLTSVQIYAPGVNIRSTVPGTNTYQNLSGTSMAAPYVAGVAALIKSLIPNMPAADIRNIIVDTGFAIEITVPVSAQNPTGRQNVVRLDAFAAVKEAQNHSTPFITNQTGNTIIGVRQGVILSDAVVIPRQINGVNITTVGDGSTSFLTGQNCVTSVTFENMSNVTTIGASAFKGCTSLSSITIPSSVTNIDANAFKNCSFLQSITIQRETIDITNLGVSVFDGCNSLEVITVPTNSIVEYKNATNWSNYSSLICHHIDGHNYTYSSHNSTTHLKECDCGYSVTENHNLTYSFSPTQHWEKCTKCYYQTSKVNHSWHTEPTGRTYCTICWYESKIQPWSINAPIFFERTKENEFM